MFWQSQNIFTENTNWHNFTQKTGLVVLFYSFSLFKTIVEQCHVSQISQAKYVCHKTVTFQFTGSMPNIYLFEHNNTFYTQKPREIL